MAEVERCLLQTAKEGNLAKEDDFSETLNSILNKATDSKESDSDRPGKFIC